MRPITDTFGRPLASLRVPVTDRCNLRCHVSLDTLRPERFRALTRRDADGRVLSGIEAVRRVGFRGLKIDTVVMRGVNEDELVDLLEYGKRVGAEVRFIEYMDVGGATQWSRDKVFSRAEILEVLRGPSRQRRVLGVALGPGHPAPHPGH